MDLEERTLPVTHREAGWRADVFVADALDTSRSSVERLFDTGLVASGSRPLKPGQKGEAGWAVTVRVPPPETLPLEPVAMPLEVVYEDPHIVVLNKPRGLVVHPGSGTREPTLVHGLLARYAGKLSAIGGVERPGIVHRLDKNTSGLLIVARTDVAHRELSRQFAAGEVQKTYVALVEGSIDSIVDVDRPIGRDPQHRQRMAVRADGRPARTRIEPLAVHNGYTLVLAHPRTGRTHQIRVHLRSLGHPIVGDETYGRPGKLLAGQFLHAWRLRFEHPVTGKALAFEAALPSELQAALAGSGIAADVLA